MKPQQSKRNAIRTLFEKYREYISYIFFGVLTTLVNFVFYWLFADVFGVVYYISTALAWFFSVLFAYITNRIWVFESTKTGVGNILKEAFLFFLSRGISGLFDLVFIVFLVEIIHVGHWPSKIITNIIVIIMNYLLSKLLVFRKEKSKAKEFASVEEKEQLVSEKRPRDKRYFEIYAALTLRYYDIPFQKLEQGESPDWRSNELGLGVEVRRGITSEQGRFYADVAHHIESGELAATLPNEWRDALERYLVRQTDRKYLPEHFEILSESLHDKLEKLNRLYLQFPVNALYVFAHTALYTPEDLKQFFAGFDDSIYPVRYDRYYINCVNTLYCYHVTDTRLEMRTIDPTSLQELHQKTLDVLATLPSRTKKTVSKPTA